MKFPTTIRHTNITTTTSKLKQYNKSQQMSFEQIEFYALSIGSITENNRSELSENDQLKICEFNRF